jgi:regulator of sigma E protease
MTIIATIVVLGVLIFVHELGHFWAAKAVGIEVERFSIGLGPRVWGYTKGETEYVLSAIPLGGYVKMGGMDDEVMEAIEGGGKEGEKREGSSRDFDSKPIWARTLVISAGVIMNMLFALFAFTFVAGIWGSPAADTNRLGGVRAEWLPSGAEALAEIPAGAEIQRVAGQEIRHWGDLREQLTTAPAGTATVEFLEPAGSVEFTIPADAGARLDIGRALSPWNEPVVGSVEPGGPADGGGLRAGDRLLDVGGTPIVDWSDVVRAIEARPDTRTEILVERDGRELTRVVTPRTVEGRDPVTGAARTIGQIGMVPTGGNIVYTRVGLAEAVSVGWDETVYFTGMILGFLRDLFTGGISPRSLGSIVTIGEASGAAAAEGMPIYLKFMALFSINLAILNLLPIPVLDGGHLLFLAIEAVRGQALSVEQRMRWTQVGFIVIIGIMVWALGNDFLRLFGL